MEYVYAAAILHKLDREINERNMTAVLEAAGADVSESRVKALIAALEDVDIEEAISGASAIPSGTGEPEAAVPEGGESHEGEPGEIEEADETLPETAETPDEELEEDDDEGGDTLGGLFE